MQELSIFDYRIRFYVKLYSCIQILRPIGRHDGQHIKKFIFLENFGARKLGSNAFITAAGRYGKLGEK